MLARLLARHPGPSGVHRPHRKTRRWSQSQTVGEQSETLKEANKLDLAAGKEKGLDAALLDRLELTDERIQSMAEGLRQIASLPDPVGVISNMAYRPSGIQVGKMRVPLGVIGIIYESRPNVTADAAGLCLSPAMR